MATQQGRELLIKMGDGESSETFTTVCGLTSKSIGINGNTYDVTTATCGDEGSALWQELQAGVKSVQASGNGIFKDETAEADLVAAALGDTTSTNFQVIVPDFGTFAGAFFIETLEFGGEQEGAVSVSLSLNSTGAVTFTAA